MRRAESYMGDDGCCHVNPAAIAGVDVEGEWLSIWGTSHQLLFLCNRYERERDNAILTEIKMGLDNMLKLTVCGAGTEDFPYSTSFRNGEWLRTGWAEEHKDNYAFIIEPLLRYYEISGDRDYLRRAVLFAESFVNCSLKTRRYLEINPETGSFAGHTHLHTRGALAGISHLAYLTGESRYLRWARRVWDFVRSVSPGFGWYPERMPFTDVSETCVNGDMMWAAYYLGLCGELDIYDEMERNWRNYLRCTQLFVTEDVEEFIRNVNTDKNEEEIITALRDLRRLEGGFIAQTTWNDLTQRQYQMDEGQGDKMLYMMGCCPPSGMLALYYIWQAAVMKKDDGIYVNMTVTADTPLAELTSDYSSEKKLTVKVKEGGNYFLRLPEWTVYGEAEAYLNGTRVDPVWDGPQCRYLAVRDAKKGDVIGLSYPLVQFTQKISEKSENGSAEFRFEWLGNSVVSVSPGARYIDLFGRQRGGGRTQKCK